jgi:hypothetical protein
LADQFAALARENMKRSYYAKGSSIEKLWEEEQKKLLTLPEVAFEVFRLESAVANKYGEIRSFSRFIYFLYENAFLKKAQKDSPQLRHECQKKFIFMRLRRILASR